MNNKSLIVIIFVLILIIVGGGYFFIKKSPSSISGKVETQNTVPVKKIESEKDFEEIKTENQGIYLVKNMIYTGTNLELSSIEKVMKDIRATCPKPCKINLYSDREAYEIDILAGEDNFDGFTEKQRSYLSSHLLGFWGVDDGDVIEFYPNK